MGSINKTSGTKNANTGENTSFPGSIISNAMRKLKDQAGVGHKDTGICIVIFLLALFVIITITNPGLFTNDEWITVNQVHQLDIGHQIMVNEGKYGTFGDTPGSYFASRNNILMYSVALPLASMPAMKLIDLVGDNFHLVLILLWAILPFLIALTISLSYPEYAKIGSVRITLIGVVAAFLLFVVNLIDYLPFAYSAPDAPSEVAAVVFTDHLFFALTIVMIYLIARRIFDGRWTALFAALAGAACSSYLFWGANAKDHMATVAVFAIMLYFFVCYIRSWRFRDAVLGFFSIGILAWIRPEIGFSAFFCFGLFFIAENILRIWQKRYTLRSGIIHISAIMFTAIGSIPFFINNMVISGNPLVPSFLLEDKIYSGSTVVSVLPIAPVTNTSYVVSTNPLIIISDLFSTLGHYIFSISPNPLADLRGILFLPDSGDIGFFFTVPIAFLALVLMLFFLVRKKDEDPLFSRNKETVILLLIAGFSVFFAYMHNFQSLNESTGAGPDIRYLTPAYIPVVLLGIMALENTILMVHPRILVKKICVYGIFLVPVILLITSLMDPGWITASNYFLFFNIVIPAEVLVIAALTIVYYCTGRQGDSLSDVFLPVLILTILSWQVMIAFIFAPYIKFNGYPFWIPGVDTIYHFFIRVPLNP